MKRIALINVLVLIMSLIAACGGSTPAATQAPAQPTATQASDQSAATEAPTQPAMTDAPRTGGSSTQVDITLADNTVESSLTTFQVGVPYTFVITNTGRHDHNFNISTPVAVVGSLGKAESTALLVVPKSQLRPGASVTVEFTFPESAAGAQLEFACLIQKHYADGMYLAITVTK